MNFAHNSSRILENNKCAKLLLILPPRRKQILQARLLPHHDHAIEPIVQFIMIMSFCRVRAKFKLRICKDFGQKSNKF